MSAFAGGCVSNPPSSGVRPDGPSIDARYVVVRLEEAGHTLLCLPETGYSTRMRSSALELVRVACEIEQAAPGKRLRVPVPSAGRIGEMDEAWSWLGLIPADRYVLRRIVGARALVSPTTERHLFSWRRLGGLLGADHRAVQRWHAEGVGWIVKELLQPAAATNRVARAPALSQDVRRH
jgi:hypothetical protein